ncbi:MAG TPA: AGE family epimerase/isomerase [Chitinophagaceae bacterium]|jgi:mannobiose 2-epimerase
MKKELSLFRKELELELEHILAYWTRHAVDEVNGGFIGRIGAGDKLHPKAPKGAVLNSRILWTFSAAYNHNFLNDYYKTADRAFVYLVHHFFDNENGGVYWTVDYKGRPLDTKKQIYALAFALYGLTEYYRCRESALAKELAVHLFTTIEQHSYDPAKGGYIDAFARDWQPLEDLRLSAKDANEKKTMNTHLHVLEAYSNLYRIWPDEKLKQRITGLINNFLQHIIDPVSHHLILFFDENWRANNTVVSYGHDIEAAWLLQEAAETIGDPVLIRKTKDNALLLARAASEGLDTDGGLWYELELKPRHLIKEKHWWPQAEAIVGFFNAWQLSGERQYLDYALDAWSFVREYLLDKANGEWLWGVKGDHSVMPGQDKAGIWKCPYHNSRACLEIIRRTGGQPVK